MTRSSRGFARATGLGLVVVATTLLLTAVACDRGGKKYLADACETDDDCTAGKCTDNGVCLTTCAGQSDCESSARCVHKTSWSGEEFDACVTAAELDVDETCEAETDCAWMVAGPCEEVTCQVACQVTRAADGTACTMKSGTAGACAAGRCLCGAACGESVAPSAAAFQMGCAGGTGTLCEGDEGPVHAVTPAPYAIDRTEVTVGAWNACVAEGRCTLPADDAACTWKHDRPDALPVDCVSWGQAAVYCAWAGRRLCSEAEWEHAARGVEGRTYPWGEAEPSCDVAVFDPTATQGDPTGDGCDSGGPLEVGARPGGATPEGVVDLSGNLWEWVADEYVGSYEGAPVDGSAREPVTASNDTQRVVRGGGYADPETALRATNRSHLRAASADVAIGLRCCSDL